MSPLSWFIPTALLIGALGGLWYAAIVLRKRTGIGAGTVGPNALPIVGKRTLDRSKSLYVVQVADRYLLLGTSEQSVGLIDRITAEEFALMSESVATAGKPLKLRLAAAAAKTRTDVTTDDASEQLEATGTDDAPQFATVGEAFGQLLAKARSKKSSAAPTPTEND